MNWGFSLRALRGLKWPSPKLAIARFDPPKTLREGGLLRIGFYAFVIAHLLVRIGYCASRERHLVSVRRYPFTRKMKLRLELVANFWCSVFWVFGVWFSWVFDFGFAFDLGLGVPFLPFGGQSLYPIQIHNAAGQSVRLK